MLRLETVSYRYAGYAKKVLRDVDLTLGDGEIVGLVGANEAGKSTLCLVGSRAGARIDRRRTRRARDHRRRGDDRSTAA